MPKAYIAATEAASETNIGIALATPIPRYSRSPLGAGTETSWPAVIASAPATRAAVGISAIMRMATPAAAVSNHTPTENQWMCDSAIRNHYLFRPAPSLIIGVNVWRPVALS